MEEQRVALVTGGIGGIGTAICKALADAGRRVAAGYHPSEADDARAWLADREAEGYRDMIVVEGDVASYEASKAMVDDVVARLGPVSILVNAAGITRDKTLRKMQPDQWQAVISTNLDSVFNVTKHVVDGMTERGFGRIVNISSVNGQKGQFGQTNYSAAKAGMHGFTMALAQEVAKKGVTVNTVSPGYVDTPMTRAMPQEVLDTIVAQVPIGRLATPEDVALAVAYVTDDRNEYTTGANLPVNGGLYMS